MSSTIGTYSCGRLIRRAVTMIASVCLSSLVIYAQPIDRYALVTRNNPVVTEVDTMASLTVGNGRFAFTTDITGLQSFPERYSRGVPLGTMSQWGWHSFPNTENYRHEETLREYDFGHGHKELYSTQIKDDERAKGACNYFRANPHRLHLGTIGFDFGTPEHGCDNTIGACPYDRSNNLSVHQSCLDLWSGIIDSRFSYRDTAYHVRTACHPDRDAIAAVIISKAHTPILFSFPYPTGQHTDDACDREAETKHRSAVIASTDTTALLVHSLDTATYFLSIRWNGHGMVVERSPHRFALIHNNDSLCLSCEFLPNVPPADTVGAYPCGRPLQPRADETFLASRAYWKSYWQEGAAVDFSECTDPRAKELERRVVLSQYLLAVQCAGDTPPQETGLTYNSWFGKFHLEMIWWHQAQFALWGRPQLLARSLSWYLSAEHKARLIAQRQGFDGIRWMKMTDPSAAEAPSSVGSFLIWQQPHIIYLSELLRRRGCDVDKYTNLVDETARFMASFASYDSIGRRYVLRGVIPAQETLKAAETINPPLELSYWYYGLSTAQQWRTRQGLTRVPLWDEILENLAPLAYSADSLYLAAETAPDYPITGQNDCDTCDTYNFQLSTSNFQLLRAISDHPAVLGALGMLPENPLIDKNIMRKTLRWIWDNWNWEKTWGWDYPMVAMCAARLGERQLAVEALLMHKRTNTYLPNGHNYQDDRLRCYLPGNGGLLTAVALMCAGWEGGEESYNPGFPDDGSWNVRWEGLMPL